MKRRKNIKHKRKNLFNFCSHLLLLLIKEILTILMRQPMLKLSLKTLKKYTIRKKKSGKNKSHKLKYLNNNNNKKPLTWIETTANSKTNITNKRRNFKISINNYKKYNSKRKRIKKSKDKTHNLMTLIPKSHLMAHWEKSAIPTKAKRLH